MRNKQRYCGQLQNHVRIANFCGEVEKLPFPQNLRISSWSYDMAGHAKKCVERYCELANKTTQQLYKVSTPCIDDHHFKEEEMKSFGELSHVCSQIVLQCLYLARIGRPDILWSVNKLARSITKWTKACDKRLNRLISDIHHTCEYEQYCSVGNSAKQCRLGLFQDSDFAGDLEDSKSTSGGTLCVFGSHTFVPISWMCKKQTSVSHSSTDSEIISLDTRLRLDCIPALDLCDLIVAVLHGKRLCRLISYIHHTCEYKQYCHVGNTAKQCRLGLFQDSDFAGDLEDSKSTSGETLCIFGSHTFVPISWMCKKQTSVSHSSTEAEMISLDAGLRMDVTPALTLWDSVIEIFLSVPNKIEQPKEELRGNPSRNTTSSKHTQNQTNVPTQHDNLDLSNVDLCAVECEVFSIWCDAVHL